MKTSVVAAGLLGGCVSVGFADSVTMVLSDMSSDETPASLLDVELTFELSGTTLTLTVDNDVYGAGATYSIADLYFNATSNVTSVSLTAITNWTLNTSVGADGFGTFDFQVENTGSASDFILAGTSLAFTFTVAGATSATDFTTELSEIPPGEFEKNLAAKFQSGTDTDSGDGFDADGDSAFGGGAQVIPLPTAAFLAFGGLGAIGLRRHR